LNFLGIDQVLRQILNVVSGLPIGNAQGDDQSQYFAQIGTGVVTDGHGNTIGTGANRMARLTYDIISIVPVGQEENRSRFDASVPYPGDTYPGNIGSVILSTQGHREIHVQITCECFDATDGMGPTPIVERVRTAFNLPSVLDLLRAAELGLQGCSGVTTTHYNDDNGRAVHAAILEVIFNGADGIEDVPETTIEIVQRPALTVVPMH
jgi:hypothetical protein